MRIAVALLFSLALAPQDPKPPSISYSGSRESKEWIKLPKGGSVAIDDGIEWRGVKVYLSLTCDLVAVDAKTGKAIWACDVGAFWNRMTFVEVKNRAGEKVWAVELRPDASEREGADLVQLHELTTGAEIPSPAKAPTGEKIDKTVWSGGDARLTRRFRLIAVTKKGWDTVRERMFAKDHPHRSRTTEVDFEKECVLVESMGDAANCLSVSADLWEDGKRILVRLHHSTVQSGPEPIWARPYGLIVLPRRPGKPIVIERNVQPYIGGPPIWKEVVRMELPADPATELEGLPKE